MMELDLLLYVFMGIFAIAAMFFVFSVIEFLFKLIAAVIKLAVAAAAVVGIIYYFPAIITFLGRLNNH